MGTDLLVIRRHPVSPGGALLSLYLLLPVMDPVSAVEVSLRCS